MGLGSRSAGSWRLQIHGCLQQLMIMLLILAETQIDIGFLQAQEVVNLSPPLHPSDLAVLRAVKNAMADLPGGSFFTSWEFVPGIDPCQIFTGVSCISVQRYSRVNLLSLGPEEAGEPGLWGPLPPELADLPFLQQLSVSPGAVSGSIPPGLGSLTYLEEFSCAQNLLTGSIPPTIGALSKLQVLQLSMNRLEGAIPAEISSLQALEFLVLSDNLLSGNIPMLSNNTHLVHLDLRHNELVGELVSFMLPESLEFLSLSKNQLSGGIGAVGSLSKLNYLDLSFNQFSGAIPSSLFGIAGLSYLLLNRNQLSGPLPMTLPLNSDEQLVTIQEVDLSFNLLQGNIPAFLAGVQSLYLNNNLFIGTVPQVSLLPSLLVPQFFACLLVPQLFACLPFDSPDQIQWTLDGSDHTGLPSVPQLFACLFACSLALCLLVHRQSRSNPVDLRWFTSNPVILCSSALCLLACPWTVQIKSS